MKCDRCKIDIDLDEKRAHLGQTLCEDCYMIVLSPMKTCDPWAVHSAKSHEKHAGSNLTPLQSKILEILKEAGALEPSMLLEKLDRKLQLKDLEREFSTLRHMEKVRGEKQDLKVLWRLW